MPSSMAGLTYSYQSSMTKKEIKEEETEYFQKESGFKCEFDQEADGEANCFSPEQTEIKVLNVGESCFQAFPVLAPVKEFIKKEDVFKLEYANGAVASPEKEQLIHSNERESVEEEDWRQPEKQTCQEQYENEPIEWKIFVGTKTYPCTQCGRIFSTENFLDAHQKIHTEEKRDLSGESEGSDVEEDAQQTGTKSTNTSYASNSKELKDIVVQRPFVCPLCEKRFSDKNHLEQHQQTHAEGSYYCSLCGHSFFKMSGLRAHQRIHNIEQLDCSQCGLDFKTKDELRIHQMSHQNEKQYSCGVCGESFASEDSLKTHGQIHTEENPYRCPICKKDFRSPYSYSIHKKIHKDNKATLCLQCGRNFRSISQLKIHQKSHRSYQCTECGETFEKKPDLVRHQTTHINTNEKPYHCSFCSRCFRAEIYLRKHMEVHTRVKPFQCSHCPKSFRHEVNLKHHLETHSKARLYHCSICNKSFSRRIDFRYHQANHSHQRAMGQFLEGENVEQLDQQNSH